MIEAKNSERYWNNIHVNYDRNHIKVDDWLDRFDSIITEKTSITDRQLKKYVNGEWYLNPEQALNLGLVHTIR